MVRTMIKYTLDIDEDLHKKISKEAEKNERSVAAEYRVRLSKSVEE